MSAPAAAEQFEVKGKVAIVTGAASGIGLAITRSLLKEGAKVMMVDINEVEGQKSLSSLCEEYPSDSVSFSKVDATNLEQMTDVFVRTKVMFGGLDIVCNNAGILYGEEIWRRMFEVNVFAVIEGIALAVKHMSTAKGGKGGVVVNTSSLAGLTSSHMLIAKYGATKHAVVGYTRAMSALAQTDGVRVNCVCPDGVDTPPVRNFIANPPPQAPLEIFEFYKANMLSPDQVAEGVLELITDTSKAGAVMTITKEEGRQYPTLLEPNFRQHLTTK